MVTQKSFVGLLIITLLLSGAVYITFDDEDVKVRVDEDKSTFYVKEGGRWVISGVEYNSLWDGTTKMNRVSDSLQVNVTTNETTNITTITRYTKYIRGPEIIDTYVFDGTNTDVKKFPLSHEVRILNGEGYIYQYEVRRLVYDGETVKNVESPQSFGRKMSVEWADGWYWNTVYKSGIVKVRYRLGVPEDRFAVRLFDPNEAPAVDSVSIYPTYPRTDYTNISALVAVTDSDDNYLNVSCNWYVNGSNTYNSSRVEFVTDNRTSYNEVINESFVSYGNSYQLLTSWSPYYEDTKLNSFNVTVDGVENFYTYVYAVVNYDDDSPTWTSNINYVKNSSETFLVSHDNPTYNISTIDFYGFTDSPVEFGDITIDSLNLSVLYSYKTAYDDYDNYSLGLVGGTLPNTEYSVFDNVSVLCYVDDGVDNSSSVWTSNNVTAQYNNPYTSSASWTTTYADSSDALVLSCEGYASSEPAENFNYIISFYKDGVLNSTYNSSDSYDSNSSVNYTLPETLTAGDEWIGQCVASNKSIVAGTGVVDSYTSGNQSSTTFMDISGRTHSAQSFTGNGLAVQNASFWLGKNNNPTGTLYGQIWSHTGTYGSGGEPDSLLVTSTNNVSVSSLPNTPNGTVFYFDDFVVEDGTNYFFVVYWNNKGGTHLVDRIGVWQDTSSPTHSGNSASSTNGGLSWSAWSADMIFEMYGNNYSYTDSFAVNSSSIEIEAVGSQVSECYQETANVSTGCGGLSTGGYAFGSGDIENGSYAYDGNWSSYAFGSFDSIYINYTKPENVVSADWKLSTDLGVNNTVDVPSACLNQAPLQFKVDYVIGLMYGYCNNGTAWEEIYEDSPSYELYEEGVVWSITNNFYQDGVSDNRTYEYDTTMNLTVTCSSSIDTVDVYGPLDNGLGQSGTCDVNNSNLNFLVNITNVYEYFTGENITLSNESINNFYSWSYPYWYNVTGATLFIDSVSHNNMTDITFFVNNVSNKLLRGELVGDELYTTTFSDGDSSESLFFTDTTRTQTVYFNVTSNPFIRLNLSVSSFAADPEPLDYYQIFRDDSNVSSDNTTGADYPYFTIDDLETNKLDWSYGGDATVNSYVSSEDYWYVYAYTPGADPYSYLEEEGFVVNNDLNINDYDKVGVYVTSYVSGTDSGSCIGDHGSGTVYFGVTSDYTDADPFVQISYTRVSDYNPSGDGVSGFIFLERVSAGSTSWKVYFGDTYKKTITIPAGEQYFVGKARATSAKHNACGGDSGTAKFYWHDLLMGGVGSNKLGGNEYNTSFDAISEVIHNPTENITAAYLDVTEYSDNVFSSMTYYLSPDNGSTWEETDNPSYHLFTAQGNALRWRAVGSSTSTDGSYGLNVVNIEISTSNPENITFDLGADDTIEYSYDGLFNISDNVSIINSDSHLLYFDNECIGVDTCIIPLEITSDANGGLLLSSVEYVNDVNPIVLNGDLPENANITYNFSNINDTLFTINISGFIYYVGDVDDFPLYVKYLYNNLSTEIRESSVDIRYSPYNKSKITEYADFRPTSFTQYDISPYGQSSSVPFWNFTAISTNHTTRLFMNMYEDLPACVTLTLANNSAQSGLTFNLTSSGQNFVNLSAGETSDQWIYLDYVGCTTGFAIDFITNSLCEDCVLTYDYDEHDGVS